VGPGERHSSADRIRFPGVSNRPSGDQIRPPGVSNFPSGDQIHPLGVSNFLSGRENLNMQHNGSGLVLSIFILTPNSFGNFFE